MEVVKNQLHTVLGMAAAHRVVYHLHLTLSDRSPRNKYEFGHRFKKIVKNWRQSKEILDAFFFMLGHPGSAITLRFEQQLTDVNFQLLELRLLQS
jgi:hypothetical protein